MGRRDLRGCFDDSLDQWSHFDRARARGWNARGDGGSFVEVFCFDQKVATELFVRFRERTVSDHLFSVAHAHSRRGRDRLQLRSGHKLTACHQIGAQFSEFKVNLLALGLADRGPSLVRRGKSVTCTSFLLLLVNG